MPLPGERSFEEIEELAREKELNIRAKEKIHNDNVEAAMAVGKSRGKAAQQVYSDELKNVYAAFMNKYAADPRLVNAAQQGEAADEYTALIGSVYTSLFDPNVGAMAKLEKHLNSGSEKNDNMEKDDLSAGQSLRFALTMLSGSAKNLEKTLLYKESDTDTQTIGLLNDIYDIQSTLERSAYGNLCVPHDSAKRDGNGKKIHRVVQRRDEKGNWIQPIIEKSKRIGSNDDMFMSTRNYPLFDHEPTESDVAQGNLGNCYMLSSLASTAAQSPELIKDCMKYNPHDNTVTVRFYNESREPVYVTVDSSVPVTYGTLKSNGKQVAYKPFSSRAYWTQIMEKAYTVSGLAKNKLSDAEKGKYEPKYEDIQNGCERFFLSQLFGYKTHDTYTHFDGVKYGYSLDREYDITERDLSTVDTGSGNAPYTLEEQAIYDQIDSAFRNNRIVSAGINAGKFGASNKENGLYSGHAYSVIRVEDEPATGKKYVVVRNPHAHGGREYDNAGNPVATASKNVDGISRLELRDFIKTFDEYTEAKHDTSHLMKEKYTELAETKEKYGKAVDFIHKALEENDNGFLKVFGKNSEQFNGFRTAALRAYNQFRTSPYNVEEMKNSVREMVDAAKEYKNYRDNNPDASYDNSRSRSVNRYNLAVFADYLGKAFDRMEAPDSKVCRTVEPVELVKIMKEHSADAPNRAAQAAFEKLDGLEKKTGLTM